MNSKFALIGVNINTMVVDTVSTVSVKNGNYIRSLDQLCVVITKVEAKDLFTKKISLRKLVDLNHMEKRNPITKALGLGVGVGI